MVHKFVLFTKIYSIELLRRIIFFNQTFFSSNKCCLCLHVYNGQLNKLVLIYIYIANVCVKNLYYLFLFCLSILLLFVIGDNQMINQIWVLDGKTWTVFLVLFHVRSMNDRCLSSLMWNRNKPVNGFQS